MFKTMRETISNENLKEFNKIKDKLIILGDKKLTSKKLRMKNELIINYAEGWRNIFIRL